MKDLSYEERLQRFKLPMLVYHRAREDIIEVYKILTGTYNSSVVHHHSLPYTDKLPNSWNLLGHSKKLFKKSDNLNTRKYFFSNSLKLVE